MERMDLKIMRALYIGRFQPYHLGHQAVLEKIADEVEEIVIVIGSAQESHTSENPFTGGERMEMIYAALGESDLRGRCYVTPLQDIKRNSVWVSHLQSMVPSFDAVYSNNPLVVQLVSEAGIQIRRPPMYQRDLYSGTAIRKLMREKCDWSGLVPVAVARFIIEMGGVKRLISVSKSDGSPQQPDDSF
ncbi:MAG: nicotinamide-nucleotide adenylyltransferase [Methanothrix sp.]|nr:nicotinamide-nucleotide adenylyltransferase [Methanothrix sp.]